MNISDFSYHLPQGFIAQQPARPRDHSRLMVLDRQTKTIQHTFFYKLPDFLTPNDLLVFNNSKVVPARMYAQKITGGEVEIILLHEIKKNIWATITSPGLKTGIILNITPSQLSPKKKKYSAAVVDKQPDGITVISFDFNLNQNLSRLGHTPLPPYITNRNYKPSWYQTIYAKNNGSVAAPTAGLHFTNRIMKKLEQKKITKAFVTLHVGLGTFVPIKTEKIEDHHMHAELSSIPKQTASELNKAKQEGKRIIAIGSTTTRLLEYVASKNQGTIKPFTGWVDNFIYPPYHFRWINGLLTNFHLPKSTLLLMISAFAGKEFIFKAYDEAIKRGYRFYSFGDAMLIL